LNAPVHDWTAHVVPMHAGVPFCTEQTVPHPPHALTLLVVAVSQPFAALASQLPKPAAHAMVHVPLTQVGDPFTLLQTLPHAPQLVTDVLVLVSQPLPTLASQFANGVLQLRMAQLPVVHEGVALGRLQERPHPPQFAVVWRFVSQPSEYRPLQSAKPAAHAAIEHVDAEHVADPFAAEHAFPHEPQFPRLVTRSVSQPFAELPSQSPLPGAQLAMPQMPATQFGVPPVAEHTFPHVLQLLTSICVLVSHPFARLPSQFLKPALHVMPHVPAAQVGEPFWLLQIVPHPPQFVTDVPVFVSQPFAALPSQSP
jgi:hypothetical protein